MEKETVNVYDFDNTIYRGDSTADLYKYCLRHYPFGVIIRWPHLIFFGILFGLKIISKTNFKEKMYHFLRAVPDVDDAIDGFWDIHRDNIKGWYYEQKKDSDIISSASAVFSVKPMTDELGLRLIASKVDPRTGKYTGLNNHGEEKVVRLKDEYPNVIIDEFYSDSLSDTPLAKISKKAFFVKDDEITPWPGL